jgi:hopanoid biosynthesis associated RND transporter like protein HpnN
LLSAGKGAVLAFAVGLTLVVILLFVALRSWRLVVPAMLALISGLVLTAGFAAAAIGHLNMISVAFGVLYIGLGIDYALYLCMQYRELANSIPAPVALPRAAADIGGFMLVCAMTTSLGFFAFLPTNFTGIAELGLISGVGMFISFAVSLTLLPALIAMLQQVPERQARPPRGPAVYDAAGRGNPGLFSRMLDWPYSYGGALWIGAGAAAIAAAFLAPRAHFDYDPLDLRDPHSESVSTYRQLLKDPNVPTLTMSVVADGPAQAKAVAERLSPLPEVRQVISLNDFVPTDQAAKLAIIDDLNFTLGPAFSAPPPTKYSGNDSDDLAAMDKLRSALRDAVHAAGAAPAQRQLLTALDNFRERYDQSDVVNQGNLLQRLRGNLLGALPVMLGDLHDALQAHQVTAADIPQEVRERWVSANGKYRVDISPRAVLDNNAAIATFVNAVRKVEPNAAGAPVDFLESGRAVVSAFRTAFTYSLIAITVLLLVLLRSVVDMLLVMIPLALAGLLTVGGSVLGNIAFNFANVIALPLILGVGVDYGVYIVQRARAAAGTGQNLLRTSTARAVLFGALITVANFGNLALSPHPGTRSMGLLLTVGLGMTMLCALVLLPSLLALRYGAPAVAGEESTEESEPK